MLELGKIHSPQRIKSIFFSRRYLESLLSYCDLCCAVLDNEKDIFFKCEICYDFIACLNCVKQKTQRLFSHRIDHHFIPIKPKSNIHWINRNLTITCELCSEKHFFGKRYQCRKCLDYNVCEKCLPEARHSHYPSEKHTFIYISNPTKISGNRLLLAHRAVQILRYFNADSTDRDVFTGWTLAETKSIYVDELKNFKEALRQASKLLEDNDIDFTPSIIENEKSELSFVITGNN